MQNIIRTVLTERGYQPISCNIPSISLYIMNTDDETTQVIVTIDETQGGYFSLKQFQHISWKIRDFLKEKELYHCLFMYLLISEDDTSADRLFPEFKNFCRIIPSQGAVMAYEDADPAFTPLQRQLESKLAVQASDAYDSASPKAISDYPFMTIVIVAINVIIFLYCDLFSGNSGKIIDWGALGYTEILGHHDWYRFISSMFLHLNGEHIFNNMLVLYFIGAYLENYLGHGKYLLLYFSTGILAGCTSIVYNIMISDPTPSIGASGAVFGIVGGLIVAILQNRKKRQDISLRRLFFMIFLSLYNGFTSQGVDNAAHIGGCISGILLCILLTLHRTEKGRQIHDQS
ncbi:MAG: rhomboid family intramembrane serine protease [Lachnospiraceae bacterium]|nr:rhomboid family intramembrane serine protease [Lachnospiraceae bacterium]